MATDPGTYVIDTDFVRPLLDGQGLRMFGSSSGYVGLKPAAAAGAVDYVLPAADGSSGDVMTTDGSGTLSFTTPVTDHGALSGLTDDDHPQYFLQGGRFGGQLLYGGTAPGNNLFLQSTSNATRGYVSVEFRHQFSETTWKILNSAGTAHVGLQSPASPDNTIYTLPASDGSSGDVLQTDGSGVMTWTTPSAGVTDHGALTGLSDDDHSQYALLAGRSGGQLLYGGTGASENLTLRSTSHATSGSIYLHDASILDADKTGDYLQTQTTPTNDNGIVNRGYMRKNNLAIGSTKTTNFTASVGEIYPVNLTSASADIVLTFPTSPNAGEKFGLFINSQHSSGGSSTNFADRPFFCIEPANNTSINGSLYSWVSGEGSGKYGLWLTGEMLIFQYTGSTWLLIEDGRIPHVCSLYNTVDFSVPDSVSTLVEYGAELMDNANLHSTSSNTDRISYKRRNIYDFYGNTRWDVNSTGERVFAVSDSSVGTLASDSRAAFNRSQGSVSSQVPVVPGSYASMAAFQNSGGSLNLVSDGTNLIVSERLGGAA